LVIPRKVLGYMAGGAEDHGLRTPSLMASIKLR